MRDDKYMHQWASQHSGWVLLIMGAILIGNTIESVQIARGHDAATGYAKATHRLLAVILAMLVAIWAGI